MIEVEGLTKRFGDRLAVEDVSFRLGDGEILGFLGPNGAGKTTTMRILTGYLAPSAGSVRIEGFDVAQSPREVKRRVGYLPEVPPLYLELLVDEYLHHVAALKGVPAAARAAAVGRVANRCGLADVRRRLIANLSKGYRQRVGLAQALVHDPQVVILDEPTSGLDPNQIQEVRSLIRETAKNRTVILSTHILQEVEALCDKVAIIHEGKIVAIDQPEALTDHVGTGGRLRLRLARAPADGAAFAIQLAAVSGVESAQSLPSGEGRVFEVHVGPAADVREQVAALVVGSGQGLVEMRDEGSRLEEVFHRLTLPGGESAPAGEGEEA